jgi:hypothetical protein
LIAPPQDVVGDGRRPLEPNRARGYEEKRNFVRVAARKRQGWSPLFQLDFDPNPSAFMLEKVPGYRGDCPARGRMGNRGALSVAVRPPRFPGGGKEGTFQRKIGRLADVQRRGMNS